MLPRFIVAVVLLGSASVGAQQRVAIHATVAAEIAKDASHARTLRDEVSRALGRLPAGYAIDVALVRLDVRTVRGELEVKAEVRAAMSDERGEMRWWSTAKTTATGRAKDRALIQRDAIEGAARQVAKNFSASARVVATR